ncbi:MAG TPA: hypothetical protein VIY54_00880 [Steroidobacteraceae bacterium]
MNTPFEAFKAAVAARESAMNAALDAEVIFETVTGAADLEFWNFQCAQADLKWADAQFNRAEVALIRSLGGTVDEGELAAA